MARAARGRARARYFENTTLRHARNHHEPNLAQYETGFQGHYETQYQISRAHRHCTQSASFCYFYSGYWLKKLSYPKLALNLALKNLESILCV